jgi:putative ABC transport system permease protein
MMLENLARDIQQTGRGLRRSPGFVLAVVLTLALGVGGNTAVFSVVDQLLVRPLPYPEGDKLVSIYETSGPDGRMSVSPANWLDWQRENRTFQGLAAWRSAAVTLTGVGDPVRLDVQLVSAEFFPVLSIAPLLGRAISEEDDRPNAARTVVLSYELWQQRFAGDPRVIGRVIRVNDLPAEIVGVMPAGFRLLYQDTDVWSALRLDRQQPWRETAGRFINVVARMNAGTALDAARADLEAIAQRLAATYEFNKNTSVTVVPLREELTGRVTTSLLALYAAVGVLLAIACFNVASLHIARATSRRREIAIRSSLGAGRRRIVGQLLAESLVLAGIGGTLGILLARWSLTTLMAFAPPELLRVSELSIDLRVLLYTLGLSVATGLIVGMAPAALVTRLPIVATMRANASSVTYAPRVREVLVVGQVAMTVVLLSGAGLLLRTAIALHGTANGFDRHDVLTMEVVLPGARYSPERRAGFYWEAIAALRALPGVQAAAASNSLPVIGSPTGATTFHRLGTPELPMNEQPSALIRVVTPGYFRTLRIPVLRGREFTEADDANPRPGFIVNEAFAATYLAGVDPLATSLSVWMEDENPYLPLVGVVGNVSEGSIRDTPQPTVFYSHRQLPQTGMTVFVRATGAAGLASSAVNAVHRLDTSVAVAKVRTFEGALVESLARERLNALVSGGVALSGLLLASIGLYGLLAFVVAERTKEIGIRIALGAQLRQLRWSVVGRGLRLVGVGAAVGAGASFVLLRSLGSLLFGVSPNDPSTYAVVLALLCAVASLASYVPARWASRVEPLVALRQE